MKPDIMLNKRGVYVEDMFLDGVDSYIIRASWEDTGEELTDEELDDLEMKAQDFLAEQSMEKHGFYRK